jgi:CspA family cold shock protein
MTHPGFDVVKMAVSSDGKALTFAATLDTAPTRAVVYPVLEFYIDADNNRETGATLPEAGALVGMEFHGMLELCVDPRTCHSEDMMLTGTIARLLIDKGFGFVRSNSGIEHFFHRSAVRGAAFEGLKEGQRVRFAVALSNKGPRAGDVLVETKPARIDAVARDHTAIVTLERYSGDRGLTDILLDLPAVLNAKEPLKTPVTGPVVRATVDYASMEVTSGQTIRLVVREFCAGIVKNVQQGFFPEIVLSLR